MRNNTSGPYFVLLILCISLFAVSCAEDPDDDINFQSEYLGDWDIQETEGINAPQTYEVEITSGASDVDIIINGLYQSGTAVRATVSGFSFTIPPQESNDIEFSGSGSANADFDQITMEFIANDGAGDDHVKATLTPK